MSGCKILADSTKKNSSIIMLLGRLQKLQLSGTEGKYMSRSLHSWSLAFQFRMQETLSNSSGLVGRFASQAGIWQDLKL